MTWIKVPWGKQIVVKNNDSRVARIVIKRSRPVVKYKQDEYYPRSWQGHRKGNLETTTWEFPLGPIATVRVHNNHWIQVVWR